MSTDGKMLRAALKYHAMGLHPIPCKPRDKIAMVPWKSYQAKQPTEAEIRAWWQRTPDANVALVLGRGIFALDLDGDGAEGMLAMAGFHVDADAPRVKTANGVHIYLATDRVVPNSVAALSNGGKKPQVDVRGDAGYVLAPPSVHPSGAVYAWEAESGQWPPPAADSDLLEFVCSRGSEQHGDTNENHDGEDRSTPKWVVDALQGVGEGKRDQTCTRLAGYFLSRGVDRDITEAVLRQWGERCRPVFGADDVRKCVRSVAEREAKKPHDDDGEQSQDLRVEHVSTTINAVLALAESPAPQIATPYATLNRMMVGGMGAGELIYLGARPGVGKSAVALQLATFAAQHGKTVFILSREMSTIALGRRVIAQHGGIFASKIRAMAQQPPEVVARITKAARELYDLPLWWSDRGRSAADLNALLDMVPGVVDFVVVDYLQLVGAPKHVQDRRQQVEYVSQALKSLAIDRKVPVLCLSSLSRPQGDGREKPPTLGSLKESSNLEHDADVVILLHREFGKAEAYAMIAKNRDGETGTAELIFDAATLRFAELERRYDAPPDGRYDTDREDS